MPLSKLQFRPGINQDITSYANEGGWRDCDKIRFRFGYPEKIGGWEKYSQLTYLGVARSLHNWIALDSSTFLGVGTSLKYYIEEGLSFNDITPLRVTTSAGDVTFAATNGSATITVTDVSHGAIEDDFVTFSGAVSLGGAITAARLNIEYQIVRVVDANNYEITAAVPANSSDTGNGGSSVVGKYQLNTGTDSGTGGTGWGAGLWSGTTYFALQTTLNQGGTLSDSATTITLTSATGFAANDTILIGEELITIGAVSTNDLTGCTRGVSGTTATSHDDGSVVRLAVGNADSTNDFTGWGDAAATSVVGVSQLRLWSHDNFGEDLIINPRDSGVYYWDKTNGVGTRAVELSTLSGSSRSVPTVAKQILVSDQDRHVIAFGADGLGGASDTQGDGVQDPLLIRFSDQEDPQVWYPTATNTAGDLRLGSGSKFITAIETKREILVWTDTSIHSMRFIGPPFTFGIQLLSANITIMGPQAVASVDDVVFWMGIDSFYIHDGSTKRLPCTVKDKVFLDFNFDQAEKVISGVNSEFSEIFWFYPSASATENDSYVVYNYSEKVWYFGSLARSAWLDRGIKTFPVAAGSSYLYNHELGYDDDGSAMSSFIESAVMDISDGNNFVFISRLIPDLTFNGSANVSSPQATFTLKARNFPGASFGSTDDGSVERTSSSPVELYTDELFMRLRGRSFAVRIDSSAEGTKWKLGNPRVDIRQDGRR